MLARALQQQRLSAPPKVQAEVKVQAAPEVKAPPLGAMAATEEAVPPPPQSAAAGGGDGDGGGGGDGGGDGDGDGDGGGEEVDGFLLRQMALRQYLEVLRQPALSGRSSVKPWKLTLRRDALCTDVLAAMSKVRGHGELYLLWLLAFYLPWLC